MTDSDLSFSAFTDKLASLIRHHHHRCASLRDSQRSACLACAKHLTTAFLSLCLYNQLYLTWALSSPSSASLVTVYIDKISHLKYTISNMVMRIQHPRASSFGVAIAKSEDTGRCVAAGSDSLRILHILDNDSGSSNSPRIEASRNIWDNNGLKIDSANTDVAWARGPLDTKIITSARNGELILWDVNRTKYERRQKDHSRSIHRIALSPQMPHYCITGSSDGDLRAWDLRDLKRSVMYLHHPSPVRSVIFTPDASHPLYVAVGLDNGSIYRWDLKLNRRGLLNRIPVAHAGPILALDWWQPSLSEVEAEANPVGYLASSGLDQTVNIWKFPNQPSTNTNLQSSSSVSVDPAYSLHPSFPVRRALFRAGSNHTTELVLFSNVNDGPSSGSVEIWDVRRPWIPKWSVSTGVFDSNKTVVDATLPNPNGEVLWTLSCGGTFAQVPLPTSSDTYDAYRPLDALPMVRGGLGVWSIRDEISAFLGTGRHGDKHVPYDNHPIPNVSSDSNIRTPGLGDSVYRPPEPSAIFFIPEEGATDMKGYVFGTDFNPNTRKAVCVKNAEIAYDAGDDDAAQLWHLIESLLDESDTEPELGLISMSDSQIQNSSKMPELPHSISAPAGYTFPPAPPELIRNVSAPPSRVISNSSSSSSLLVPKPSPLSVHAPLVVSPLEYEQSNASPYRPSRTVSTDGMIPGTKLLLKHNRTASTSGSTSNPLDLIPQLTPVSSASSSPYKNSLMLPPTGTRVILPNAVRHPPPSISSQMSISKKRNEINSSPSPAHDIGTASFLSRRESLAQPVPGDIFACRPSLEGSISASGITFARTPSSSAGRRPSTPGSITSSRRPSVSLSMTSARHPSISMSTISPISRPPVPRQISSTSVTSLIPRATTSNSVGDGALDDSDSDSDGKEDQYGSIRRASGGPEQERLFSLESSPLTVTKKGTFPASPHLMPKALPSPLSRKWSEDYGDNSDDFMEEEDEEIEDEEENAPSPSPNSTESETDSSEANQSVSHSKSSHTRRRRTRTRSRSSTIASLSANAHLRTHPLIRQESQGSIRTVTADDVDEDVGAYLRAEETIVWTPRHDGRNVERHAANTSRKASAEKRKSRMEEDNQLDMKNRIEARSFVERKRIEDEVKLQEKHMKESGWQVLKDIFEELIEQGNTELSAFLSLTVPTELQISRHRKDRLVEAHVENLTRIKSYVTASHMRKYAEVEALKRQSQLETTLYTTCGRCRKPLVKPAFQSLEQPARGAFSFCLACTAYTLRCSICHLPVQKLLVHCSICGHGGHQACYRTYYASTSMVPVKPSRSNKTHIVHDVKADGSGPSNRHDTSSLGQINTSEENQRRADTGSDGPYPILGHLCASGCGHFCWTTTIQSEV